ncbi:hypothetical protein ABIA32_003939 [Streptacidiphilus sp. MAP12-20]|uniref:hypothetical protein n=1 Tax=Streptacidiphilus sp. MAP12-20 TaxID=3156299 RepID=UPI0035188154
MKRWMVRFAENVDAIVPLVLGIAVSVLSLLDLVSAHLVENSILVVIAVLSFALLRDRWNEDATDQNLRGTLAATLSLINDLQGKLALISRLEQSTRSMHVTVQGLASIRTLKGADIDWAFRAARKHTDRWMFKGGTGTYTRAVTLPVCAEIARRERRALTMRLEILDPTNEALCEQYARYRTSVASGPDGTGEFWTTDRTRKESFATILAACWHQQGLSQILDIGVGLTSTVSTFRFDLSANQIIITQDDGPAVMISDESPLYDGYATELRTSFTQARRVPLESALRFHLSGRPTCSEVRALFVGLQIDLPEEYGEDDLEQIIEKAVHAKNPYGDPEFGEPE